MGLPHHAARRWLVVQRRAENVVKVGTDQVRGVDTTHYHLDVNLQKAVQQQPTPEARAALQQLVNSYTVSSEPADVWLDSDGRVRRLQRKLDFSTVRFPPALAPYIVQKGSIAIDGISLTVAGLSTERVDVQIVPYTMEHTNLRRAQVRDRVNLECDMIGKYVVRATELAGLTLTAIRPGSVTH